MTGNRDDLEYLLENSQSRLAAQCRTNRVIEQDLTRLNRRVADAKRSHNLGVAEARVIKQEVDKLLAQLRVLELEDELKTLRSKIEKLATAGSGSTDADADDEQQPSDR